jgi:hypothetical protein
VQLIIIRSFIDEYINPRIEVPVSTNDSFSLVMDGDEVNTADQNGYQSGVGKLLYLSR